MSKLLKRAVKEYTDEMMEEENKKIQIALNRTMDRVQEEVDKYLEQMATLYYQGYNPISYIRTMQLQNKSTRPVKPYAEINRIGNVSNLSFGVIFNEDTMNHGSYTIKARWYDKKKKKWKDVKKSKTYTVKAGKKGGQGPDEAKILEYFQDGVHPNSVPAGMTEFPTPIPLFTEEPSGAIPNAIEKWLNDGGLQNIFNEELKKLYR
jgi:hypothetical protein